MLVKFIVTSNTKLRITFTSAGMLFEEPIEKIDSMVTTSKVSNLSPEAITQEITNSSHPAP